jgi:hypothetical protein
LARAIDLGPVGDHPGQSVNGPLDQPLLLVGADQIADSGNVDCKAID